MQEVSIFTYFKVLVRNITGTQSTRFKINSFYTKSCFLIIEDFIIIAAFLQSTILQLLYYWEVFYNLPGFSREWNLWLVWFSVPVRHCSICTWIKVVQVIQSFKDFLKPENCLFSNYLRLYGRSQSEKERFLWKWSSLKILLSLFWIMSYKIVSIIYYKAMVKKH